MGTTLFESKGYRGYLRFRAEERGLVSRLAEAAQCQKSHISRVLSEQLHLTPEQAYRVGRFLGFNDFDQKYFMKMVELERCGDPEYRASLKAELAALRATQEDLSNRQKSPSIGELEKETTYYSSWHWSALHIIVSIPKFQTVAAIAKRLNLSEKSVEESLKQLANFGLVKHEKGRWKISTGSIHLPKTSPNNSVQHLNWRLRAVESAKDSRSDGVHYTIVQSVSVDDFEKIKQMLLKSIDKYTEIARPSAEEELICLTMDFFKV